jgi:predicted nucleic-acid-binding protein
MKFTLDTNVLVRLATQDDPQQAALAIKALKKASLIAIPTTALCEMVWVLLRGYRYNTQQVAHALKTLMQAQQVVCDTAAVMAGLALLENGGDFADGVIAFEGMRLGGQELLTFDSQAAQLLKAQGLKANLLRAV